MDTSSTQSEPAWSWSDRQTYFRAHPVQNFATIFVIAAILRFVTYAVIWRDDTMAENIVWSIVQGLILATVLVLFSRSRTKQP